MNTINLKFKRFNDVKTDEVNRSLNQGTLRTMILVYIHMNNIHSINFFSF